MTGIDEGDAPGGEPGGVPGPETGAHTADFSHRSPGCDGCSFCTPKAPMFTAGRRVDASAPVAQSASAPRPAGGVEDGAAGRTEEGCQRRCRGRAPRANPPAGVVRVAAGSRAAARRSTTACRRGSARCSTLRGGRCPRRASAVPPAGSSCGTRHGGTRAVDPTPPRDGWARPRRLPVSAEGPRPAFVSDDLERGLDGYRVCQAVADG